MDLINGNHPKSTSFIDNIRRYNSMFAFTSIDAKQDMSVNQGHGTYCYRIQGENYHRMGTLLPDEGNPLMFAQLYIYDTQNEIDNRIKCVSNDDSTSTNNKVIDHQLTVDLRDMLDNINPLVSQFRMAGSTMNDSNKNSNNNRYDDNKVNTTDLTLRPRGRPFKNSIKLGKTLNDSYKKTKYSVNKDMEGKTLNDSYKKTKYSVNKDM
nr:hypothetical protein CTI12_AA260590 [Tanacetum cinerariifolium]